MRFVLPTLLLCALVTAHPSDDPGQWNGGKDKGKAIQELYLCAKYPDKLYYNYGCDSHHHEHSVNHGYYIHY
ncbi:hypothetical protein N7494_007613 [Penicillium frequentans]|uniref:Secreted protein n=1 Tax=Penicillium frequentans TaxID=3151616 RepID=A0AAD6CVE9_9EURO|nr:hypothetical protein N7494_007613 [Penicillium glabrum]